MAATAYTIIGVLPAGFQFSFSGVDVWVTQPYYLMSPFSPYLDVFARLKPRVDIPQASAELAVLDHQYNIAHPGMLDSKLGSTERVTRLRDQLVDDVRSMLWMLFGAVGFVLLIACANVACLPLARASSRSHEFAVRAALGAGRWRLIGQLLAESILLAFAGGALGVLLAKWSLSGITGMTALDLPRVGEIRLDGMVLGFAVVLSFVTGALFGLAPALGASRPDLADVLRARGEASAAGGSKLGMLGLSTRGALVIGQVALSIVLLIGATLWMESLSHLRHVDPGFEPANLEGDPGPGMFRPCAQTPPHSAMFAVRTEGNPLRYVNSVRSQVLAIDRDQAVSAVRTMEDLVEAEVGQRRLILMLLGLFAGTALLLALVGIYGVIAHTVAERTKEVGIRRALGAQQGDILRLVLGRGLGLALGGVAIGLGGAFALTRVLESLLYHVKATDPTTFVGIALLFIVMALAASYVPARRAARIDPMAALRN